VRGRGHSSNVDAVVEGQAPTAREDSATCGLGNASAGSRVGQLAADGDVGDPAAAAHGELEIGNAILPSIWLGTEPVYYEGRPVYLYSGHWYYREGPRWRHYEREPPVLYQRRVQGPPPRRLEAPPRRPMGPSRPGPGPAAGGRPGPAPAGGGRPGPAPAGGGPRVAPSRPALAPARGPAQRSGPPPRRPDQR
jgi:hypothetical protein